MFAIFKKIFSKRREEQQKRLEDTPENMDKNLKMMSLSAIVLIVLFIYTVTKTDHIIHSKSYYVGIVFLFVLLIITLVLQRYKNKLREKIPRNKFTMQLEKAQKEKKEIQLNTSETQESSQGNITATTSEITFKDVAGIKEIKEELEEVVDFLNHPKKYQQHGVSLPRGVLLVGPPGVGKTLIAKAVAGEAQVPFFYQSGASFVHIYVGMGAKRVRELFAVAKYNAPSIIFIDEIDAVGKARGTGSNDEREATLNELLTQMDGFDSTSGVMVVAATNKIEVLDEALLRAGRFDRRVFLTLPTKTDRIEILKLYLYKKSFDFDIEKLANETSGFSSSALATLVNESLLYMIKRGGSQLLEKDLELAKQKIQFGKKQITLLSTEQKDILATYQAGKAYISNARTHLLDDGIVNEDLIYPSKTQLKNRIKKYLAGSMTLEVMKNESYVVFENELHEAYRLAEKMVEDYKMASHKENLLQSIKDELKTDIISNSEKIREIRNILLKDEVVF